MTDPVMLLSQVHGEGRVTFRSLRAAGYYTLAGVAEASIHVLSERAHLSVQTARRLKAGAEEMLERGIGAPGQEEPPAPAAPRARSSRSSRLRAKEAPAAASGAASISFGPGVSLEEALMLCQTGGTIPEPFFTQPTAPTTAAAPGQTAPAVLVPRLPEMAAAAEAAASLVRVATTERCTTPPMSRAADACSGDHPGSGRIGGYTGQTFWSFG